jgi:NAD(P)-dependent dehydrogenase (short-subunit alcohol dehydrogenase family)
MGDFDGRTVFVTGGANPRGMSYATARAFLSEGASVFLFDRDGDGLAAAAEGLAGDGRLASAVGDVRSAAEVESALEECERALGPVDVLVNHAGIGPSMHTLEISERDWDEVIGINLTGIFTVGRATARRMSERGHGVILNMSSSGGIAAEPGHAHYAASKAGILALTRAMAHDLGPRGIRVCTLCPGDIDTYEWGNVELARLYRMRIAAGRSGRPEEVAAVYLYLASEDARHLNGAAFVVDGGMLAWE